MRERGRERTWSEVFFFNWSEICLDQNNSLHICFISNLPSYVALMEYLDHVKHSVALKLNIGLFHGSWMLSNHFCWPVADDRLVGCRNLCPCCGHVWILPVFCLLLHSERRDWTAYRTEQRKVFQRKYCAMFFFFFPLFLSVFLSFLLTRHIINRINQGINHRCKSMPGIMVTMATVNNFKVPLHTEIVSAVETLISLSLQIHYFHMSSRPQQSLTFPFLNCFMMSLHKLHTCPKGILNECIVMCFPSTKRTSGSRILPCA